MRVAVIRFSSLGDCILLTGALKALYDSQPGMQILVVTKPQFAGLFRPLSFVEDVLTLDDSSLLGLWQVRNAIQAWRPQRVVDAHGTLRGRLLRLWMPGFRWTRIRKYSIARRLMALLHRPVGPQLHITQRYGAALLQQPAVSLQPVVPDLRDLLAGSQPGVDVVLVPGAAWATKQWPVERFVALAASLVQAGRTVWVLGGDAESNLATRFQSVGPTSALRCVFQNRTMPELAAELASAQVVVAGDTGLMHLASAVGTPVVALFGPTAPILGFTPVGPRDQVLYTDEPCSPCTLHGDASCPRKHHACMQHIQTDRVLQALQNVLPTETA